MKSFQRVLLPLLLCLVIAAPALAGSKEATISLSRTPEPPFCAIPGQTSVQISWNITYATTPLRVKYFLQDPTRLINLESQIYPNATGVSITRNWAVPLGSVDGKYWVRVEFWSLESGNEANAEVTFYVCSETGTICATKLADTNCNGQLDPGVDQPIPGWWVCLTTPLGDDYCKQAGPDGQACWSGIPFGTYTVYEVPATGWETIGPAEFTVTLVNATPQSVTFLNRNLALCYHACCLPNGSCVVLLETDCVAQGGTWQSSPTCTGVTCPQPPGACCLPDGSCQDVTAAVCQTLGGQWHGYGTDCATTDCAQPPGACCFPDGHCQDVTALECQALGGQWHGYGTDCASVACPQPPGACCLPDGSCQDVTAAVCQTLGGQWHGYGSDCATTVCPQPPGACCFPDGICQFVTAAECQTAGGVWQGFGTDCDPNLCPPPTGNCCNHAVPECLVTTEALCVASGFEWLGAVPCDVQTNCKVPVPTGNCCDHAVPECLVTTQAECAAIPGEWLGAIPCDVLTNCKVPVPTGNCCNHAVPECLVTTQAECVAIPGEWLGAVPCDVLTNCREPVPTERTSWGQIKNIYR